MLNCSPVVYSCYQSLQKQIQWTLTLKQSFKIALSRIRLLLIRLLKCLKQTANERPFIQTCILEKYKFVAKLFRKWQSFYLLMFRSKPAPSYHFFLLPLLYQTPVNKFRSFFPEYVAVIRITIIPWQFQW